MGGTLPVLARFFTEAVQEVQRKVGLLYALNTLGLLLELWLPRSSLSPGSETRAAPFSSRC